MDELTAMLTRAEAETGLRMGLATPATRALSEAVSTDPLIRGCAEAMVALGAPVEARCHITRWRNALLRDCLGHSPHG